MKPLPGPKFLKSKVFENKFFQVVTETFFETKIFETDTETFFETKVFETDTETFFRDQIFSRPIPRLFFETKYFRDRYRDFFSRLNIFETDTETFFRDQNFRDRDRYSQKIEKSLDTEKSRDEMSHSASESTLLAESVVESEVYLLLSECNCSAMLTRRKASTPRRKVHRGSSQSPPITLKSVWTSDFGMSQHLFISS